MKPVLFLDIDGVLNSARFLEENPGAFDERLRERMLDGAAVARLQQIYLLTGMEIVISSSWRLIHTITDIAESLRHHGFEGPIIGSTGLNRKAQRGGEIKAWLDADRRVTDNGVCILDDDSDMVPLMHRLVKTSWGTGLLDEHVDLAVALLLD